jgi:hypothetical protein
MKRVIFLIVGLLPLLILIIPIQVHSAGIAIGPQSLEVNDAIRGGDYERIVTVFNPTAYDDNFRIGAQGQAGSWLSFSEWQSKTPAPLETFPVGAVSNIAILVKIKVPQDAANGSYKAIIFAETKPQGVTSGSQVSAVMRSEAVLSIGVSGNMIVDGVVNTLTTQDTEAGYPIRLEVNFKNTGNVAVQPKIDYQIMKGTAKIAEDSYNKTSVGAGSTADIGIELATSSDLIGDYLSHVSVSIQGKNLATKDLPFKILPAGTFSKKGEIASLQYEGNTLQNTMLKILTGFKNTGEGDARAKFIGEVYVGSDLVDTVKSEDIVVPVRESGILTAYLKLSKAGMYVIKGYVAYEGKRTEAKEISLNVAAAPPQASMEPSNALPTGAAPVSQSKPNAGQAAEVAAGVSSNLLYYIGIAIGVMIIVLLVFTLRKRGNK